MGFAQSMGACTGRTLLFGLIFSQNGALPVCVDVYRKPKQVPAHPKVNNLLEKGPLNNRKSPKKGNLHDAEISRLTTTSSLDHMVLD